MIIIQDLFQHLQHAILLSNGQTDDDRLPQPLSSKARAAQGTFASSRLQQVRWGAGWFDVQLVHCLVITDPLQQHLQRDVVLDWPCLQMKMAAQVTSSTLQHHSRLAAEAAFRSFVHSSLAWLRQHGISCMTAQGVVESSPYNMRRNNMSPADTLQHLSSHHSRLGA